LQGKAPMATTKRLTSFITSVNAFITYPIPERC
jgi:hypothetical protein